MGGKQFWGDELFFHGWHIQRNTLTDHCRLLDAANRRHAWGAFDECQTRLEQIKREQNLPPMRGKAVILLHGLFRSSRAMNEMADHLHARGGYTVFSVTYPTTRSGVDGHAAALAGIVRRLDGIEEINFVGHSLGNLVIRHYLADETDPAQGKRPDERIKRIVMLGPPNNGAQMADSLGRLRIYPLVAGQSGVQIRDWQKHQSRFATPGCEFAIIAGGRGGEHGYNPLLRGDNDLVVSVETTRLPGAADFAVLPVVHTHIMDDPIAQQYTLRFLQSGYFIAADKRQPIFDLADRTKDAGKPR